MAEQILMIPFLNPIKFVEIDPIEVPQYLTKHFDDYLFAEQIADYEFLEQVIYVQKWHQSDLIPFQMESNYDPINISLIDHEGNVVLPTLVLQNLLLNKYQPGMYIYEGILNIGTIPEGCYYLKLEAGDPVLKTMISEPISIKEKHNNTVRLDFSNNRFHGDVVFETGIVLPLRVEGALNDFAPGGTRNVYEDEKLNPYVTQARPFREFTLTIGDARGVPDWIIDKLNWIWSCNNVTIDGKSFAMTGTAFEYNQEENFPMRGVKIKVREGINRGSKIVTAMSNPNLKLVVGINVETKLFGDVSGNGSNNVVNIFAVE